MGGLRHRTVKHRMNFQNKNALVTGASGKIGEAIALDLCSRGATTLLTARNKDRLQEVSQLIQKKGGNADYIEADIATDAGVNEVAARAKRDFEKIHVLVNNAGRELLAPLQATKPESVRELFEINVTAMAMLTRACLNRMRNDASVVNMASMTGLTGSPGLAIYSASKAAVIGLTRSLALEFASRRIRVNAIAPGVVRTEMADRILKKLGPEKSAELELSHPLGFGEPEDVARAVAFVASDDAKWMTGHTVVIDGGFSA